MENRVFEIQSWIEDIVPLKKEIQVLYIKEKIVATLMSGKFDSMINDSQLGRDYEGSVVFKQTLNSIINDKSKEISTIFELGLVDAMIEIITTKDFLFETMHLLDGKYEVDVINNERIEKVIYHPMKLAPENMKRIIDASRELNKGNLSEFIETIRYHPEYKWYATTLWREALEREEQEILEPLKYHNGVNYYYYAERFLSIGDWKSYSYCTMQYIKKIVMYFGSRDLEVQKDIYQNIVKNLGRLTREKKEVIISKFGEEKYNELKNTIRDTHTNEYYNIFDLYM